MVPARFFVDPDVAFGSRPLVVQQFFETRPQGADGGREFQVITGHADGIAGLEDRRCGVERARGGAVARVQGVERAPGLQMDNQLVAPDGNTSVLLLEFDVVLASGIAGGFQNAEFGAGIAQMKEIAVSPYEIQGALGGRAGAGELGTGHRRRVVDESGGAVVRVPVHVPGGPRRRGRLGAPQVAGILLPAGQQLAQGRGGCRCFLGRGAAVDPAAQLRPHFDQIPLLDAGCPCPPTAFLAPFPGGVAVLGVGQRLPEGREQEKDGHKNAGRKSVRADSVFHRALSVAVRMSGRWMEKSSILVREIR